jgi:phage-related protein
MQEFGLDNDLQDTKIPRRYGGVIPTPYLKSRRIRIRGILHNTTTEATHSQWLALQAALLANEGNLQYRSDRYISCFCKSVKPEPEDGTDRAIINVDIDLLAKVPFFYSTGASYSVVQNAVKGTTLLFDIFSGGNVFAEPKFSFCATGGTIDDDLLFNNLTNGQEMRFRGIIANGATLTVDVETLEVKLNGADALSYFEGDFINLLAGTNSFQFVGGTFRLTTDHKYRWY